MKKLLLKIRNYTEESLRRQLEFYLFVWVLLPMTLVTALLFLEAGDKMKEQALVHVRQRSRAIGQQIDKFVAGIVNVSDNFAYDEEIEEMIEADYRNRSLEKQKDIYNLQSYFTKTDPFNKNERISAIYTKDKAVFNLENPYWDKDEVEERMVSLGATDRSSLSMFRWHPLQDNFLSPQTEVPVRQKKVVVGVRRILHPFIGSWMYTQFFCVDEEKIFELYRESAAEMEGQMILLDENDGLISSSNESFVEAGKVPQELLDSIRNLDSGHPEIHFEDQKHIVEIMELEENNWRLVSMVPVSVATAPVNTLFKKIVAALAACVVICGFLLSWLSRRFLKPVEVLDASMKEVYDGNLEAYVKPELYNGEIQKMMVYYNAMLVQINHFIEEQIAGEKKKKELELEVLMGQINPHFLYNTLENIVWKSNEAGYPDIGRVAASLGRLYRLSIGNGEILVSLRQEVEHMMAYVAIQKNRYKERIKFDLTADMEQIRQYSIIKLTLQPIVENCFMYAIEGIDRMLKIRVDIQIRQDILVIRVADNGSGLTRQQLDRVRKQIENGRIQSDGKGEQNAPPAHFAENFARKRRRQGAGIGMYSVKERIAIYTGFQDSIKIQSRSNSGTIVTIRIPKLPFEDKNNQ